MSPDTEKTKATYMLKHIESLKLYKEMLQEENFSELEIAHLLQEHQAHLYRNQAMSGISDMQKMVQQMMKSKQ